MKIAIIGATGLVGRTFINILQEKGYLKNNTLLLYASKNSHNTTICVAEKNYVVKELCKQNIPSGITFAFFSAGSVVSKVWAKEFIKQGAIVIDNSSAFRRYKNVPLVVPQINSDTIKVTDKLIANPNCSTIGLSLVLSQIQVYCHVLKVNTTTFQAVSGAGAKALKDLECSTNHKLPYKITNNLIPHIDKFLKNGYTCEEEKLKYESQKILNCNLPLCATAVRVPIKNCHSEAINLVLEKPTSVKKLKQILQATPGVCVVDDPNNNLYPMPIIANGTDQVFVGRIRKDPTQKNAFNLFICFDNIRKGASLNAVEIMECIINNFYKTK